MKHCYIVILIMTTFLSCISGSANAEDTSHEPMLCTFIGCENSILINLPKTLILKPDHYTIKIKFENREDKIFEIPVNNLFTEGCQKYPSPNEKYSTPIYSIEGTQRLFLVMYVNSTVCLDNEKSFYMVKSVEPFSSIMVNHSPNPIETTLAPVKMEIEILNGQGKSILKRETVIQFNKNTAEQPNGGNCGPICYAHIVDL